MKGIKLDFIMIRNKFTKDRKKLVIAYEVGSCHLKPHDLKLVSCFHFHIQKIGISGQSQLRFKHKNIMSYI